MEKDIRGITIDVEVDSAIIEGKFRSQDVAFIGDNDAISLMRLYNDEDVPAFINRCINIEIKAKPKGVGYPINIIRITKDGIKWIQKNQICD
jgi:hypothetical protein